jgi:hypothetical protein
MARQIEDRLAAAQDAFDAGFQSKAAQKRALDELNRAYFSIRDAAHTEQIKGAPSFDDQAARRAHFNANEMPFDLHHVRDLHIEIIAAWGGNPVLVRDMIALRLAIKAAEIAPPPVNENKVRVETVRKSIVEEMERRHAQYVEGLDMARHFGGLHVSVNAHWVYGHKGAVFLRRFFYLAGRLTPLNTIVCIAEQLEREKELAA